MIDMASKQFLPAFIKYTRTLADTVSLCGKQEQILPCSLIF